MINRLAEIPYWLAAAVALLAVMVWFMGNNRLDKTLKRVALGLLAAAVGIGVVSYLLESDREQVARHTRALVGSVEDEKWDDFKALLHPQVRVLLWSGPEAVTGAATAARRGAGGADDLRITGLTVEETGGTYTSRIQVVGANTITNWDLEWEESGEKWLLIDVNPLGGPGLSAEGIESRMRRQGAR